MAQPLLTHPLITPSRLVTILFIYIILIPPKYNNILFPQRATT